MPSPKDEEEPVDGGMNIIERLSLTFTANGKRQNKTFVVCLQLSVQ